MEINPLSANRYLVRIAEARLYLKDYQAALKDCDGIIEKNSAAGRKPNPELARVFIIKTIALLNSGKETQALEAAVKAVEFDHGIVGIEGFTALAIVYAWQKDLAALKTVIADLESKKALGNNLISGYNFAVIYAASGEKEEALDFLEEEARSKKFKLLNIAHDPLLDLLREDPRFRKIESQIKASFLPKPNL